MPQAPPPGGRIPPTYSATQTPPCVPRSLPAALLPTERTRGHLHAANLTAPAAVGTRDPLAPASLARVRVGPTPRARQSWSVLGLQRRPPRSRPAGPTPLSLLPRQRRQSAARPSAAPPRLPRGPGNSQMGRYHPRAPRRGGLSGAARPRLSGLRPAPLTLPRPARWFAPRRAPGPAGPAAGARWGSAANSERSRELGAVRPRALSLRSRVHTARTRLGEVCRDSVLFRKEELESPQSFLSCVDDCPARHTNTA